MPIAEFTEVSLAYERIGSGIPLLLIMGVGGQLIQWPPDFKEALQSEGFELILVDNRDIGLSSKLDHLGIPNIWNIMWRKALGFSVDTPYTLEDMAADYIELLDHLNIQQCHILGISMGSMISQILAAKYPERISTVTLVHTGTGKPRHSLGIKPRALKALASRGTISSEEEYAEHFQQLFSVVGSPDLQRSPEKLREAGIHLYRRANAPAGFKRQFAAILATGDREEFYSNIHQPTSIIHGYQDPLMPMSGAKTVAKSIPQSETYFFEDLGHDIPIKYSTVFAQIVKDTIQRTSVT